MLLCAFVCLAQAAVAPTKEDFDISEAFYSTHNAKHAVITVINLKRDGLQAHFQFEG